MNSGLAARFEGMNFSGRSPLVALVIIAGLPLIGYQFGVGSQLEQFPIVARMLDPDYLTGDFFLDSAASFGPRIYYARALAGLNLLFPLAGIVLALTLVFNFLLALVTYIAARKFLRTDIIGGLVAAMMVVLNESFSLGLAGNPHFDSFQPASVAIPLSLAGFSLLVAGRPLIALPLFAAASLAHPLIGVEIALIGYAATAAAMVLLPEDRRFGKPFIRLVVSGILFVLFVFLAWALPSLGGGEERLPDAEFFDILARLRAPHHYLGLGFPRRAWLIAILFTGSVAAILVHHARSMGLSRETLALAIAGLIVVVLCAASLWFVDIAESRIWVTAQVFRMVMLIKWVGFLALGWLCSNWVRNRGLAGMALSAAIVMATAEAHAYVIALAAVTMIAIGRRWLRGLFVPVVVFFVLVAGALITKKYGIERQSFRALAAVVSVGLIFAPWRQRALGPVLAVVFASAVLTVTTLTRGNGLLGRKELQARFSRSDITGLEAQVIRQASVLSPRGTLWIVPPDFESFRFLASRPVVADFTSIPFGDMALREWKDRLNVLYGPFEGGGFTAQKNMAEVHRKGTNLADAAARYGAEYAILYVDTPWEGPVLFENADFKVVRFASDN